MIGTDVVVDDQRSKFTKLESRSFIRAGFLVDKNIFTRGPEQHIYTSNKKNISWTTPLSPLFEETNKDQAECLSLLI